jgi:hypothetical protein
MTAFTNVPVSGIGTIANTVFTATEKSILIGCNLCNTTNQTVPASVILNSANTDVFIRKNFNIATGSSDEIMKGNKIVLKIGDSIKVQSSMNDSIDVVLSILTGVS